MIEKMIASEERGKKLHRYVRQTLPGLPLSGVHKLIRVGRVKVNGKKGKIDTVLETGDSVQIWMNEEDFSEVSRPGRKFGGISTDIDVIYEDGHLLVVNKPVGLLTHPDRDERKDTLIGRALAYLHARGELADGRSFLPAAANRLDRNTSGLVLIGKDGDTLRSLSEWIRDHRVRKGYLAVAEGRLADSGVIDKPLMRHERDGVVRATVSRDPGARSALTRHRALAFSQRYSLLAIEIASGRTHQIRAHLKSIGHPLLGDYKYGGHPAFGIDYHVLHAYYLHLPDGRSFTAPPPPAFLRILAAAGLPWRNEWLSDANQIAHDDTCQDESRDRRDK